jgi:hypothetical protein
MKWVVFGWLNYIGDIGPTDYVAPNDIAIGFVYKWNRSTSFLSFFLYLWQIGSQDRNADVPLQKRERAFENSVHEFSAGLEFNFFEFDFHH